MDEGLAQQRPARHFDAAPHVICGLVSRWSVIVAGTAAREKKAREGSQAEGDADGVIRMFLNCLVRAFGVIRGLFLDVIERGRETFAGFRDFFTGDIGGGGHQGARILSQ